MFKIHDGFWGVYCKSFKTLSILLTPWLVFQQGTQGEVTACDVGSENVTFSDSAYHTFVRRDSQAAPGKPTRRFLGATTKKNDDLVAEEVLEIVNIQVPSGMKINFDIFMDANADAGTPLSSAEYVATYTNMPLRPHTESQKSVKVTFPIAIGMKLRSLGLENEACVPISLVPKVADGAVAPEIVIDRLQFSTVVAWSSSLRVTVESALTDATRLERRAQEINESSIWSVRL